MWKDIESVEIADGDGTWLLHVHTTPDGTKLGLPLRYVYIDGKVFVEARRFVQWIGCKWVSSPHCMYCCVLIACSIV